MKIGLQKLFKKKEEAIDISSLTNCSHSELSQLLAKYDLELKNAHKEIEALSEYKQNSKQAQTKLEEELQLYKTHCEALQTHAQTVSVENEDLKQVLESKNQEVKHFRTLVGRDSSDQSNLLAQVEELSKQCSELSSQLNLSKQTQETSELKLSECHQQIQLLQSNLESTKKERNNLDKVKFQLEYKVEDLEAVVRGKNHRVQELQNLNQKLISENSHLQEETQTLTKNIESLNEALAEKTQEIQQFKSQFEESNLSAKEELQRNYDFKIQKKDQKIQELELQLESNYSCTEELKQKVQKLQNTNEQLNHQLKEANQKRKTAKQEVIKLNKRIESLSKLEETKKLNYNIKEILQSTQENKAIKVLKLQVETLYKGLMSIMMNSKTTRDQNRVFYQIPAERFSVFEKELNYLMMNAHEASESPSLISEQEGWFNKFSTAVSWAQPGKLFSCMSEQQRTNRTR